MKKAISGFTIVELLIVIVTIAVLATITTVSYKGVNEKAHDTKVATELDQIKDHLETYAGLNKVYPATQPATMMSGAVHITYVDSNCTTVNGTTTIKQADWIPGLGVTLPQSGGETGARGRGCYAYQSDGTYYVLSAWNMIKGEPQTKLNYRRVGFRPNMFDLYWTCNQPGVGGINPAPYDITKDYYKYSYTLSNITSADCDETPPAGA